MPILDPCGCIVTRHTREVHRECELHKAQSSKLEAYRTLVNDMRDWHSVMAYSDFEQHERKWDQLIFRAVKLEPPK